VSAGFGTSTRRITGVDDGLDLVGQEERVGGQRPVLGERSSQVEVGGGGLECGGGA
jgi:hypothetical protein